MNRKDVFYSTGFTGFSGFFYLVFSFPDEKEKGNPPPAERGVLLIFQPIIN